MTDLDSLLAEKAAELRVAKDRYDRATAESCASAVAYLDARDALIKAAETELALLPRLPAA